MKSRRIFIFISFTTRCCEDMQNHPPHSLGLVAGLGLQVCGRCTLNGSTGCVSEDHDPSWESTGSEQNFNFSKLPVAPLPAHPSAIQVSWCQALRHRTPSCPPCCPRHACRCCRHFAARRCHQAWHQRPSPKVHESRRSQWWLPGALDPPWPKLFSYHWWHYLKVPHQWQISCFHPSGFARLPWVALGHQ